MKSGCYTKLVDFFRTPSGTYYPSPATQLDASTRSTVDCTVQVRSIFTVTNDQDFVIMISHLSH